MTQGTSLRGGQQQQQPRTFGTTTETGSAGGGKHQFQNPFKGAALDGEQVYVLDYYSNQHDVQVY